MGRRVQTSLFLVNKELEFTSKRKKRQQGRSSAMEAVDTKGSAANDEVMEIVRNLQPSLSQAQIRTDHSSIDLKMKAHLLSAHPSPRQFVKLKLRQ